MKKDFLLLNSSKTEAILAGIPYQVGKFVSITFWPGYSTFNISHQPVCKNGLVSDP